LYRSQEIVSSFPSDEQKLMLNWKRRESRPQL
jgi:hypothetical protein